MFDCNSFSWLGQLSTWPVSNGAILRPVYTGDFLSQHLNATFVAPKLLFQRDFSANVAAISQEFRTCSKLDAVFRRFLTKLNHKGPLWRFFQAGFQFAFVWLWPTAFKKFLLHSKKTCIHRCLRLRRALGTVLANTIGQQ